MSYLVFLPSEDRQTESQSEKETDKTIRLCMSKKMKLIRLILVVVAAGSSMAWNVGICHTAFLVPGKFREQAATQHRQALLRRIPQRACFLRMREGYRERDSTGTEYRRGTQFSRYSPDESRGQGSKRERELSVRRPERARIGAQIPTSWREGDQYAMAYGTK